MSDLEELGYLVQPHTSAGRIPSDKGYRLYVNKLLQSRNLDFILRHDMKGKLIEEIGEVEQLIYNAARILSKVTNYTSLAIAPQIKKSQLKHIQLIPIDDTKILAVIVTNSGTVKNTVLRIDSNISYDHLNIISNYLNDKLKGYNIGDINAEVIDNLVKEIYEFKKTILDIVPIMINSLEDTTEVGVFLDGVTKIFDFPEYNDLEKAKEFISFVENKPNILTMLLDGQQKDVEITIGSENSFEQIKNCSVITATYSLNGKTIGKIGVIGPTRMDYSNVINVVRSLSLDLDDTLKKFFID